jgi:hypothetical protein
MESALYQLGLEAVSEKLGPMRQLFDQYFSYLKVDRAFLKRVLEYVHHFETKNEDHIQFLGSNLLGQNSIKYLNEDSDAWIDEVLVLDEWSELEDEFHDLESVDESFLVSGSLLNASHVYIGHRFLTSPLLKEDDRVLGGMTVMKMLQYKYYASLLNYFFPYKTQESVALALYESLSRKSLLKRYGSWGRMIEARAYDIVDKKSIHYETFLTFSPDDRVLYVVTDIQSRCREIIKKLNTEYRRLKDKEVRILSEGHYFETEDGPTLKDIINQIDSIRREMETVIFDTHDLIREELIEATLEIVPTVSERLLRDTLRFIAEKGKRLRKVNVLEMVDRLILYIQDIQKGLSKEEKRITPFILRLRNSFRSSQQSNEDILFIKDQVERLVDEAIGSRNRAAAASTRIATLVYLSLRIITYKHFH